MKSITYEEFLEFGPCYLDDPKEKALMDSIAQRQDRWTALDILELKEIPDEDKLWCVLREEVIDPKTCLLYTSGRCYEKTPENDGGVFWICQVYHMGRRDLHKSRRP